MRANRSWLLFKKSNFERKSEEQSPNPASCPTQLVPKLRVQPSCPLSWYQSYGSSPLVSWYDRNHWCGLYNTCQPFVIGYNDSHSLLLAMLLMIRISVCGFTQSSRIRKLETYRDMCTNCTGINSTKYIHNIYCQVYTLLYTVHSAQ